MLIRQLTRYPFANAFELLVEIQAREHMRYAISTVTRIFFMDKVAASAAVKQRGAEVREEAVSTPVVRAIWFLTRVSNISFGTRHGLFTLYKETCLEILFTLYKPVCLDTLKSR